jgi:hypothetical protein
MKFKTLITAAVAAAFALPLAVQAQGGSAGGASAGGGGGGAAGGTTTAPSATHPQGNPNQTGSPSGTPGTRDSAGAGATGGGWTSLDKNKDGYLSREELKDHKTHSFSSLDKDNDGRVSRSEFDSASSGTGSSSDSSTGSSSGSTGATPATPKSPSSGGMGSGSSSTSKEPK